MQVQATGKTRGRKTPKQNQERRNLSIPKDVERLTSMRTYTFARKINLVQVSTDGTNNLFYARSWALSDLAGYTEFTNLYDQYRFECVKVNVTPALDRALLGSGSTGFNGILYHFADFDDDAAPSTEDDFTQRSNVHTETGVNRFGINIEPRVALAAYSGAFTSYANQRPWIDVASPGVRWYGWKLGVIGPVGEIQTYNISYEVVVSFRSPR
jgi:hypothetical protein